MRILPRGRRLAESRMTSTWSCTRTAEELDPATGQIVKTVIDIYTGPGRLHSATSQAQREIEAGATVTLHDTVLSLPSGAAPDVSIGDVFVCTAAPDQPGLVDVSVKVTALPTGEQTTADRFGVEREVPLWVTI